MRVDSPSVAGRLHEIELQLRELIESAPITRRNLREWDDGVRSLETVVNITRLFIASKK